MLVAVLALQAAVVASAQTTLVGITNQTWRYFDTTGGDPGVGWQNVGFDDNAWLSGRGLFGNDTGYPYPFVSTFAGPSGGGPLVSFFRTTFNWVGTPTGVVFTMTNYFDDGVVIYLNGTELTRYNMPAGPADQNTLAPGTLTEPVVRVHQIALDTLTNLAANPLVAGNNVLAASVHNNAAGSSDSVFGLSVVASQTIAPCTDGIQPTNRTILVGRSTTFVVVQGAGCGIPAPTFQWYRNVGAGEEMITGATGTSYTLTNAMDVADEGVYYCRLTNPKASVDSRQAVLVIEPDTFPPVFLTAQVVGPGFNTFRLTVDEELCIDPGGLTCGTDATLAFNWHIYQSDALSTDLGVASVSQINATTYEFTTSFPRDPSKQYQITVDDPFGEVGDLYGNRVAPGTFAESGLELSFQQGDANGYTGTQDTGIHSGTGIDTPAGADTIINVDGDDGGIRQALLRFDNIFGTSPGQIPPGAVITAAILTINQTDPGNVVNFHRMLANWDQNTTTWNLLTGGLNLDDAEVATAVDAATVGTGQANGPLDLNVTATVRAWAGGAANYGWAIVPTGGDGWRWNSSESGASTAPRLSVQFSVGVCTTAPTFTTQPPATTTVNELSAFSLTAGVDICGDASFQWTKNNVDIPGATSVSYSVPSAIAGAGGSGGTYRLRASNQFGSVTSDPAVVTVVPKTSRPHVTRVVSSVNGTTITVAFSEAVSPASAQNTGNYTLTPSVAVSSAVLGANNTVTLTTGARSVGTAYSLRIAGVTDISSGANPIDPNPTIVSLTTASVVAGAAWADTWFCNTNNLDADPTWKNVGYVPGADWISGPALFGAETGAPLTAAPAPIGTALQPNNVAADSEKRVTAYFRKQITLPALPAGASYAICHYTDDGFIAYLDGVEIHRFGMPAGAVTFTNRSTGIPTGEATMNSFTFTATPGVHTLAAELHQAGTTSSDVLFGMEVHVLGGPAPSLSVSRGGNGDIHLSWPADSTWQLRNAATVNGQYNTTTISAGSGLGKHTVPSASATNNNFFQLHYICLP